MQLPIHKNLKNGIQVELDYMHSSESDRVRKLLNSIVIEGKSYPQKEPLTKSQFNDYWLLGEAFVVKPVDINNQSRSQEILAAFYIKPNFTGKCSHICNAGFIVQPKMRGLGIGRFMGETMLYLAKSLGYQAVMFNLVFETNIPSIKLWESLKFQTIGRIPFSVQLEDNSYIDALIMYRRLRDES
ncbi:MAG: N-acetyltransferase [Rivularia sp. (in: cyanobacteria)]|jgi:GNAT superfamily N-acetyltransferase